MWDNQYVLLIIYKNHIQIYILSLDLHLRIRYGKSVNIISSVIVAFIVCIYAYLRAITLRTMNLIT